MKIQLHLAKSLDLMLAGTSGALITYLLDKTLITSGFNIVSIFTFLIGLVFIAVIFSIYIGWVEGIRKKK